MIGLLASLLWFASGSAAETPGGAPAVFPYPVSLHRYDNGLTAYVVQMEQPGVAAWATWMSVGSRNELDAGRTGFAHFFEHLMFLGTDAIDAGARQGALLAMAADDNAWTWLDETVYHTVLPADRLEELIALEADRFLNLTLTVQDVQREAGAVAGEHRKGKLSPARQIRYALYAEAFQVHPYGHPTIGLEADIADMPTAHAYASSFFADHYRPENATLIAVGPLDPEQVFQWIEQRFGGWRGAPVGGSAAVPVEPIQEGPRSVEVAWSAPTAPWWAIGWKAPSAAEEGAQAAALDLIEELLLSEVGPLHRRLVVEQGLAFAVSGGRDDLVDPGLFSVYVRLRPCVDAAAEDVALAEVERVVREEVAALASVDAARVERVRMHERQALLSSLDSPTEVRDTLGHYLRRGGPGAIDRYFQQLAALSHEEVRAAAARWLVPAGETRAVLRSVAGEQ